MEALRPFFQDSSIRLYLGNCLTIIPQIDERWQMRDRQSSRTSSIHAHHSGHRRDVVVANVEHGKSRWDHPTPKPYALMTSLLTRFQGPILAIRWLTHGFTRVQGFRTGGDRH